MSKKICLVFPVVLFLFSIVSGQKVKARFSTINSVGALIGESHPELLFQSVNGVKYNDFFAGIGVGIDQYQIVSLPLYLDVRMDFGDDKKGFVYADIGHNSFLKDNRKNHFPNPDVTHAFSGGIYTDIGVGVRTSFIKKIKIAASIGHSYKRMNQKKITHICPFIPPCYDDITNYQYGYGRFDLKIGLAL